ncbi:adenylyl-sulfate kinase [Opitutales bacterium]|nr:adenylyl-sulfate kinase [Opitutales bacterium]
MGNCFWLTGFSGTGKTTLSTHLTEYLRTKGRNVVRLDGDELRSVFASFAYTKKERLELGFKYSKLCKLLTDQGCDVVIGVIGLFKELHSWNRQNISNYIEIFIDTPLAELKKRDSKGIYSGTKLNVAGVDLKVDLPTSPDIHLIWEPGKVAKVMQVELLTRLKELRKI